MRKITFKFLLIFTFSLFSLSVTSQTAQDEDTGPYTTCNPEGQNTTRTSSDLPNAVNIGTIDDRSCYADYKESTIDGTVWGIYNITNGSNHMDAPNTLQPRIERSLPRSQSTGVGSYAKFTGTVRILETGKTTSSGNDGSYLIQAKGKHTGGGGSNDPAICLYLAKPVYGTDDEGKTAQVSFNVFREQINFRGGSGAVGRDIVFLTNIKKNVPTYFKLDVGFRKDPNDSSKKIHYADAVIGNEIFNWDIPEPERGTESGIRYGAYRVKGGRAQIRWANTTYEKVEKNDESNVEETGNIYSFKNVATGKYLTDSGQSAKPVTMSDSDEAENTHFKLVESGTFFNIESENFGILRAPGADFSEGPYVVVSTSKNAPATDSDKVWTVFYNESDDKYRFESRTSGRFLYEETDGTVTHMPVEDSDDRSNWNLIIKNEALSVLDSEINLPSIKVFPNPANDKFTINFRNIEGEKNIEIYNIVGKLIYKNKTNTSLLKVENNNLRTGIYLIKVFHNNKVHHKKIIIK